MPSLRGLYPCEGAFHLCKLSQPGSVIQCVIGLPGYAGAAGPSASQAVHTVQDRVPYCGKRVIAFWFFLLQTKSRDTRQLFVTSIRLIYIITN